MSQICDDCGNLQHAEYALKKAKWLEVAQIEEILCLDCLGRRVRLREPPIKLELTDFEFLSVGGLILIDAMPEGEERALTAISPPSKVSQVNEALARFHAAISEHDAALVEATFASKNARLCRDPIAKCLEGADCLIKASTALYDAAAAISAALDVEFGEMSHAETKRAK